MSTLIKSLQLIKGAGAGVVMAPFCSVLNTLHQEFRFEYSLIEPGAHHWSNPDVGWNLPSKDYLAEQYTVQGVAWWVQVRVMEIDEDPYDQVFHIVGYLELASCKALAMDALSYQSDAFRDMLYAFEWLQKIQTLKPTSLLKAIHDQNRYLLGFRGFVPKELILDHKYPKSIA